MKNFILNGKDIAPCDDIIEWGTWLQSANRHVGLDANGEIKVSTIFLGINHGLDDEEPELFETMIFGGAYDGEQWRYATYEQAEKGHVVACKRAGINK